MKKIFITLFLGIAIILAIPTLHGLFDNSTTVIHEPVNYNGYFNVFDENRLISLGAEYMTTGLPRYRLNLGLNGLSLYNAQLSLYFYDSYGFTHSSGWSYPRQAFNIVKSSNTGNLQIMTFSAGLTDTGVTNDVLNVPDYYIYIWGVSNYA